MCNYQAECFYPDVDSSLISNFNHHITVPRDPTHGYLFVANFDNPILNCSCFTRSFRVGIKFSSEFIKLHYHIIIIIVFVSFLPRQWGLGLVFGFFFFFFFRVQSQIAVWPLERMRHLCLVRHGSFTEAFSSPEAALLLVSTKNRDLWPCPTPEVRNSRTSRHSAHVQSQVWQIWLVLVSIYCVFKAIQKRNVVGPGQRSRFLVLTKRSAASGNENVTEVVVAWKARFLGRWNRIQTNAPFAVDQH